MLKLECLYSKTIYAKMNWHEGLAYIAFNMAIANDQGKSKP